MRFAVLQFPGSNCDQDCVHVLGNVLGQQADYLWHKEESLGNTDAVVVPGGFSYGDYLRTGSIAQFSPVMNAVKRFANDGGLVIGICNGFQILCEAGLLPGALVRNECMEFRCLSQALRVEDSNDRFNRARIGTEISLPIAHGEGNYRANEEILSELEANDQVLLRYLGNPNGSINDVAGIRNQAGNVYGMMPHPERACDIILGSEDGKHIFESILEGSM